MGILATYKAYRAYEGQYRDWDNRRHIDENKHSAFLNSGATYDFDKAALQQKKANTVADSMMLLDNYAQSKASDVEAVFQTLQIELLAGLSAASALPSVVPSLITPLNKFKNKNKLVDSLVSGITRYKNANIKLGKFNISAVKLATAAITAASAVFYIPTVKDFVINQIGATRRAKFEGMNKDFSNIKDYAILSEEQEKQVRDILNDSGSNTFNSAKKNNVESALKDFIDTMNISASIDCVNKLLKDKNTYKHNKQKYDESLKNEEKYFANSLDADEVQEAQDDKSIFQKIIKQVDVKSQDSIERIEKVINVGYSSLFVGGFLEYLLSEKAADLMKIKNPILKKAVGFGVPLASYLVLNKALANVQNNAIKAVRYKNLTELVSDSSNFADFSEEQLNKIDVALEAKQDIKKESLLSFLKSMSKDIKDYKKYQETKLEDMKKYIQAKRKIELTQKQIDDATQLQRNAFMAINKVDDMNQKYSESIETLSEIALAPIEIASTAIGAAVGNAVASKIQNKKFKAPLMALGSLLAFIPSAVAEVYTTGQQRKALRISGMLASKELEDYRHFVNYDNKSFKQQLDSSFAFNIKSLPQTFVAAFQQKLDKN